MLLPHLAVSPEWGDGYEALDSAIKKQNYRRPTWCPVRLRRQQRLRVFYATPSRKRHRLGLSVAVLDCVSELMG
jgi:hypothetical protein